MCRKDSSEVPQAFAALVRLDQAYGHSVDIWTGVVYPPGLMNNVKKEPLPGCFQEKGQPRRLGLPSNGPVIVHPAMQSGTLGLMAAY